MRWLLAGFIALFVGVAAYAEDVDGEITAIDREAMTITLDDGKSYKLPDEFVLEGLTEGVEVVIAFEEVEGVRQITDMAIFE